MINFIEKHENFKEKTLIHRRFKHKDVLNLIEKLPYEKSIIGRSFENRDIYKIKIGQGNRKILLWSQMHGDEATATMAIFDIFNFFRASGDEFDEFRKNIVSKLELHFIPMLNPDGAERFHRLTAQEIDMNRDALALQCPESRILKTQIKRLNPEFSFNLHDQAIYYAAGNNSNQAAISFLATAFDKERNWNVVREKSMKVICSMNESLQKIIPYKVGRFSDEFEPRAFGDNIQKWGSSLILIESGGYKDDVEKQYLRALNFQSILVGLDTIAEENYSEYTLKDYESIPENQRILLDLKIRNVRVKLPEGEYLVDLGIIKEEKNNENSSDFTYNAVIEEIGDLSTFYGLTEWDAEEGLFRSYDSMNQSTNKPIKDSNATFIIEKDETRILIMNGEIK